MQGEAFMKKRKALFFLIILLFFVGIPFLTSCDKKTDMPPAVEVEDVTVQFDSIGGTLVSKQVFEKGGKATKPTDPIKTDYIFKGWYLDSHYTEEWLFDKNVVEKDITLYAKWEPIPIDTYTILFMDSLTNNILFSIKNVASGSKINEPKAPTKEDYIFKGWYKENNTKWDFKNDIVTETTYLYAHWEEIEYHFVHFIDMDGVEIDFTIVIHGEDVELPEPPKVDGYYFTGWSGQTTNITSNTYIQATYMPLTKAADIPNKNDSEEIVIEGQVVAKHAMGVLLMDETGFVLVYNSGLGHLKINDYIRLKATISTYAQKKQLIDPKDIEVLEVRRPYQPVAEEPSPFIFEVGQYIQYKGVLTKNNTHYNINVNDLYFLSIAYPLENLDSFVGQTVIVNGYLLYLNYSYLNIMLDTIGVYGNNTFKVTYLDDEGNVICEDYISEGMASVPPIAPIKEGYTFIGWTGGDYSNVTEDLVLRPQYSSSNQTVELSILEVNDLHGYLEQQNGITGISNLAYIINSIRNEKSVDDIVLIANGDMFQGTGISNITRGKAVIDCMNAMDFDVMGLGNHEFDWGLNEILKYFDNDLSNGEAEFPLLNANVYLKATNELVMIQNGNMFEYKILDKCGVNVAIISYIGNIITSIAHEKNEPYYFDNDIAKSVEKIALPLKENGLADIVVVNIHDGNTSGAEAYQVNTQLAQLSYSKGWLVDAVINGHTHTRYTGMISRDGVSMPVVQAQSYGRYLGRINLSINMETKKVVSADCLYLSNYSLEYDHEVQTILDEAIATIDNEEFCILEDNVTRTSDLQKWHGYTAIQATGADVFVSNVGGIRATGGIEQGKAINLFQLYEISPFDNVIYLMTTTQAKAAKLLNSSSIFYVTKNDMTLSSNQEYTFAIISYVYFWSQLDSVRSSDDIQTEFVIRDLLIEDLRYRRNHNISFNPVSNPNSVLDNKFIEATYVNRIYYDIVDNKTNQAASYY